jgi:hypothetical protein
MVELALAGMRNVYVFILARKLQKLQVTAKMILGGFVWAWTSLCYPAQPWRVEPLVLLVNLCPVLVEPCPDDVVRTIVAERVNKLVLERTLFDASHSEVTTLQRGVRHRHDASLLHPVRHSVTDRTLLSRTSLAVYILMLLL